MIEAIIFGLLTAVMLGVAANSNRKMDINAKKNHVQLRETTLAEIDRAGLSIVDFPKYEDALRGERHLKVNEIIDIYYVCRAKKRR